jgi:DNA replication and repair protein RecF
VLRSIEKGGGTGRRYLEPWNESLAKAGAEIVAGRARIVNELSNEMGAIYQEVAGEKREVEIKYKCTFEAQGPVSSLEERMWKGLEASAPVEERARTTVVGPHRDDVEIRLGGKDARFSASQGEQRTIAFCVRMVQRGYLEKETGKTPILLLDDVLSELDAVRRRGVLMVTASGSQTLITTTELPEGKLSGEERIIRIKSGRAELD